MSSKNKKHHIYLISKNKNSANRISALLSSENYVISILENDEGLFNGSVPLPDLLLYSPEKPLNGIALEKIRALSTQILFVLQDISEDFVKDLNERNISWINLSIPESCFINMIREKIMLGLYQRELDQRQQMLENYENIAGVILLLLDLDGNISMINQKGKEVLECEDLDIKGKNWFDNFIPEDIRDEIKDFFFNKIFKKKILPSNHENEIMTRTGKKKVIYWNNILVKDHRDEIIGVLSSGEDITYKKIAEDRISVLGSIIDESQNEIYVCDPDNFRFIMVNKGAIRNTGYSIDELSNMTPLDLASEKWTYPDFLDLLEPLISGKQDSVEIVIEQKRKDGSTYPVQVYIQKTVYESRKAYMAIVADITEKKRTEEKLTETSILLESTLNAIPDLIGIQKNNREIIRYNKAGYDMLGLKPEEVVGKKCYELINRKKPCDCCATEEAFKTKKPARIEKFEKSMNIWLDARAYPILDENGDVSMIIEHLRDITSRKNVEIALKESEEELRAIFKAAGNVAFITTHPNPEDLRIIEFSPGSENIFGYRREEMIGKSASIFFLKKDFSRLPAILNSKKFMSRGFQGEITLIKKNNKRFPALFSIHPINDSQGNIIKILGVAIDISHLKRVERQLQRYKNDLEEMVKQRTKQLEEKNQELERLNNLFIGREFRIKELKNKIEELKKP